MLILEQVRFVLTQDEQSCNGKDLRMEIVSVHVLIRI